VSTAAKRACLLAAAVAALIVACDQVVKALVESKITIGEEVDFLGPLKLTLAHNRGVAFGIAGGTGAPLVAVMAIALGVVVYLFWRDPTRPGMWVATGLLAGGAIGNMIDRVRLGHVTDYIDLPSWPPFNLADMSITAGVIVLVLIYLRDSAPEPERE
jgi:signal peptidase II